jgi:1,4-alpha-glucan branching enzyme
MLNSDALEYGGSGQGNAGAVEAVPEAFHGHGQSLSLTLPPLSVLIFKKDRP